MPAEQHDGRGQIVPQTHLVAERGWINLLLQIKIGAQNHSRRLEYVGIIVTKSASLFDRAFRAGDDILLLQRLDPEARRIIGQIGNERHKWPPRINRIPAFTNLPIKVRDHRDKKIRRVRAPEFTQQSHQGPVKQPNRELQDTQEILASERPAILKHEVVLLLDTNAR